MYHNVISLFLCISLSLSCFLCVMHLTTHAQCLRLLIIFSDKFPQFLQTIKDKKLSFFNFFISLIIVLCLFLHFFSLALCFLPYLSSYFVVYLDQCLGSVHSKHWSFKFYSFKMSKRRLEHNCWMRVLFPEKTSFHNFIDISDTKNKKV